MNVNKQGNCKGRTADNLLILPQIKEMGLVIINVKQLRKIPSIVKGKSNS